MEVYFHTCPFQENHLSNRKKEKWKNAKTLPQIFLISQIIFFLITPVSSLSSSWDGIIVTQADFQALQAFKHNLIDPKGFLRSWNDSGFGACSGSWAGIKCAQGQVIVIQLPWRGLGGTLTEKIGQFQALRKLSLHDNFISGAIPTSLGFLPNLRGLQLFNNRFSGSIPSSLGLCPLLQTIDFGNNSLSGVIPSALVNSSRLFRVDLSYNLLSGEIPLSFAQSPSLIYLALENNSLSGNIPDSWGGNGGIGGLSRLRTLDLSNNFLNGSLPDNLSSLKNLTVLDLSHNQFTGRIPGTVGNITSLRELDLDHNNFSGEIPSSLGDLPILDSFNVSYNNLSGPVPLSLSRKFNSTAFVGNLNLCGYSDSTPCPISPSQTPPTPGKKGARRLSTKDIILIAVGALLVILLVVCCILVCCLLRRRKTAREAKNGPRGEKGIPPTAAEVEAGGETGGKLVHFDGPMVFSADDLLCATAEIMGKSTYGTVYKATMEDGIQVAVKRLREKITKGQREFETEVNGIGKIRHPNLLALRAYYLGPKGEKLLVFDYMPKGSLATFLHARAPDTPIDWSTRMKIAKGMTRGLLYLHNNVNIIHGNLTSSNVLLDEQANAKIADYGLSRLMTAAANANVIATAGALGYRAPELSKLKKATTKTDVYSLGVIVLELLTGKSPGEAMNGTDLPQWVASIVKEEWTNEVFDLELMRDATVIGDELLNTLKLALHCVDPSPSARPEAGQVLQQLEEIRAETAATSSGDDGGAIPSPSD
ncbi:probable leucine-rich repeat receptor-like protein kinase imk3 [Phtheirospermum japonicum]|uniref:Probable leucine-rich repeat receptor-like protein kinase imk3 n=1 Tax=Phtheirospermum japonicum TaxID=374723 RepID=A0A830BM40_9LAMI|nr:probable leucine-rich repeat receptor-like protein kinase imk3 [Phtheirospermum japonicum]